MTWLLLAAAVLTVGCDGNGKDQEPTEIKVADKNVLVQQVYADKTSATSVSFETLGPWTSDIAPVVRAEITPDWISIKPSSGSEAGDYTVAISLDENPTGRDRVAVITLFCGESEVDITVTQKSTKEDGTVNISLDELIDDYEDLYLAAANAYTDIDRQYSILPARKEVAPSVDGLYAFWEKAYDAIDVCNLLIEIIDTAKDLTAAEKNNYRYTAVLYRGTLHAYLSMVFGGVPYSNSMDYHWTALARVTEDELAAAVHSDMNSALDFLSGADIAQARFISAIMCMTQRGTYDAGKVTAALEMLEAIISSQVLTYVQDLNGDGLQDANDRTGSNLLWAQTRLLIAEALVGTGFSDQAKAIGYVNEVCAALGQVPILSVGATGSDVLAAVKSLFNTWDAGLKYPNKVRWGETADWGTYTLLPIPQQAMDLGPKLMQNAGW